MKEFVTLVKIEVREGCGNGLMVFKELFFRSEQPITQDFVANTLNGCMKIQTVPETIHEYLEAIDVIAHTKDWPLVDPAQREAQRLSFHPVHGTRLVQFKVLEVFEMTPALC